MTHIPEVVIAAVQDCIITTRDLCGNEREAAYELIAELGYSAEREKIYKIANFRGNAEWDCWRRAANVPAKYRMA